VTQRSLLPIYKYANDTCGLSVAQEMTRLRNGKIRKLLYVSMTPTEKQNKFSYRIYPYAYILLI